MFWAQPNKDHDHNDTLYDPRKEVQLWRRVFEDAMENTGQEIVAMSDKIDNINRAIDWLKDKNQVSKLLDESLWK